MKIYVVFMELYSRHEGYETIGISSISIYTFFPHKKQVRENVIAWGDIITTINETIYDGNLNFATFCLPPHLTR